MLTNATIIKAVFMLLLLQHAAKATAIQKAPQDLRYLTYICSNKNGVLVPMPNSCSGFFICVDGNAIASSCGSFYHFNPQTAVCDHPLRAGCLTGVPKPPPVPPTIEAPNEVPLSAIPRPQHPDEVVADASAGNICEQQPDGTFFAKANNCAQFYVCIRQHPYRRTCPLQEHFNAKRKICQAPLLAQCKPKVPHKHEPPTKTTECLGIADGTMLQHSKSCNQFIKCNREHAFEMKCPEGLHFSKQMQRCEWPWNAHCLI